MIKALNKMLDKKIQSYRYDETLLQGGTIADVRLLSGEAVAYSNEIIPFKMVYKTHKKYNRPGDPDSWRREYDLFNSDFYKLFSESFRMPLCYDAILYDDKCKIRMEYINAPSGYDLDIAMLEKASYELGKWQGKIFAEPQLFDIVKTNNLSDPDALKRGFDQWNTQNMSYDFIISENCWLSEKYKKYYINNKSIINHNKSIEYNLLRSDMCGLPENLKRMLYDIDENQNEIFESFKSLPIVLCQRDFWVENIFYDNGKIIVIDWDTAGWGYLGEDIAQLIIDDVNCKFVPEYINMLIPAYCEGFYETSNISKFDEKIIKIAVRNFILIKFGYRIVQNFIYSNDDEHIKNAQQKLQYIYDLL